MTTTSTRNKWIPPCDLCGNLDYETVQLLSGDTARQCRECGLLSITHGTTSDEGIGSRKVLPYDNGQQFFNGTLIQTIKDAGKRGNRSMLIIGSPTEELIASAMAANVKVTALVLPGTVSAPYKSDKIEVYQSTLEQAPFLTDQFDTIICTYGLETIDPPSLLFKYTRIWLVAGGLLLAASANWGSLGARIWKRRWLRQQAACSTHFLTPRLFTEYAERYGYHVKTLNTRSVVTDLATLASSQKAPSFIMQTAVVPVSMLATLLNMGGVIWAELIKGGVAMRPLLRPIEEEERASGFAPAMYTGMRREGS